MKLDKIFSPHTVLAQGKPIRIFGTGDNKVTVTFAGMTKSAMPENGKWLVEFSPMEYGGPFTLCAESEGEKIQLSDIYVGKVFLFAGQSNMQFKLESVNFSPENYENNDKVRFYCPDRIEKSDHFTPDDGWIACTKENAKYFSAIAYISSTVISKRDGVAVGAVGCYQGASVIESWLPEGTYERMGFDIPLEEKYIDHVYEPFSEWNKKDGILYNYAFLQVAPFSFNGIVWYQGESDTTVAEATVYADAMCELIDVWRRDLMDEKLPFVIVQIADFDPRKGDEGWMMIQKAQEKLPQMRENVHTVISRDVCETNDIHPRNKTELSERIAELL